MRLPDRAVPLLVNAAPVRERVGRVTGAVTVFQDISRLKRLEQQREDFIRAVSHDLRTPLSTVVVAAEVIKRQAGNPQKVVRGVESVVTAARRMDAMIQNLVDSARIEAGQLVLERERLELRDQLEGLIERLAGAMETQRITLELPPGVPEVWADPLHVERMLTNLLSNALKYGEPGTPVRVSLAERPDEVQVAVSDQGPGIAPEDLRHLFERYYRAPGARERRHGVGLGLFIVKGLVEAHGGRVWVESAPGRGSTFYFTLPRAQPAHPEAPLSFS
ncbi:MAG: sensor histidine kinase [Myxococcaceae bacterium]